MKPEDKAKEYAIEYAENMFPYDIGGDDNWNEKHDLVEEVAETACLFMYEWCKEDMLKEYRKELNEIYKHYLEEQKQQFIEWAADWLEGVRLDYYSENTKEFIEKFKNDAEEQL